MSGNGMAPHVKRIEIRQFGPYLAVTNQEGHTLTSAIPLDRVDHAEAEQLAWCLLFDMELTAIVPFDPATIKRP